MKAIVDYLLANPIIPVFLSLSLGYLLGRLKIKASPSVRRSGS